MEPNFIEGENKALDVLSVKRLVRDSLPGKVRCRECDKLLFTAIQAKATILRALEMNSDHFDMYECPVFEDGLYHLTSLDKSLKKPDLNPWLRRKIAEKTAALDGLRISKHDVSPNRKSVVRVATNLVVVDGRIGPGADYTKALRRKIVRALVVPVSGLRKPRTHLLRRRFKPPQRLPRRDMARTDLPRGETMTKMLSWANGDKFHVGPSYMNRPRGGGAEFRRRCRAREAEAVRQEIVRECYDLVQDDE